MTKYGMRYSTIKYWQDNALSLRRMRGHIPAESMAARFNRDYATMEAREIGHLVIQLSAVDSLGCILLWDWTLEVGGFREGFIVRVVNKSGQDCWLGQRIYLDRDAAYCVRRNHADAGYYPRVYVQLATPQQFLTALSII